MNYVDLGCAKLGESTVHVIIDYDIHDQYAERTRDGKKDQLSTPTLYRLDHSKRPKDLGLYRPPFLTIPPTLGFGIENICRRVESENIGATPQILLSAFKLEMQKTHDHEMDHYGRNCARLPLLPNDFQRRLLWLSRMVAPVLVGLGSTLGIINSEMINFPYSLFAGIGAFALSFYLGDKFATHSVEKLIYNHPSEVSARAAEQEAFRDDGLFCIDYVN